LALEHDPEKWMPVFRKRSCGDKQLERGSDSIRTGYALAEERMADA